MYEDITRKTEEGGYVVLLGVEEDLYKIGRSLECRPSSPQLRVWSMGKKQGPNHVAASGFGVAGCDMRGVV